MQAKAWQPGATQLCGLPDGGPEVDEPVYWHRPLGWLRGAPGMDEVEESVVATKPCWLSLAH